MLTVLYTTWKIRYKTIIIYTKNFALYYANIFFATSFLFIFFVHFIVCINCYLSGIFTEYGNLFPYLIKELLLYIFYLIMKFYV